MRNIISVGVGICIALAAGNAFAVPTYDGLSHQYEYREDTENSNKVGPGYGGQNFDVEYLGMSFNSGKLSFALQTGFDLVNGAPNYNYTAGDFAISLDNGNGSSFEYALDFAISVNDTNFTLVDMTGEEQRGYNYSGTDSKYWRDPDSFQQAEVFEAIYEPTDPSNTSFGMANSYNANAVDAFGQSSFLLTGMLDLSLLDLAGAHSLKLQWTMGCGNDIGMVTGTVPDPVPEPATMVLFGAGLAGLTGVVRKRKKK